MNMDLILNIAAGVVVAKAVIVIIDASWAFICNLLDLTKERSND